MTRPIALVTDGPRARRLSRRSLLRVGGAGILGLALPSFPVQGQPTGHPILWTADWSPDGKYLAVGGNDGSLRVFSADLGLLETHRMNTAVQCVDWNRDGRTLAIALDDRPVEILDVETGRTARVDRSAAGSRALAWKPDGELLAVGDYDGLLEIRAKDGKRIRSIKTEGAKTYLSVDWHPAKDLIVTGSDRIRVFNAGGGEPMTIKHREEDAIVLTVKWHPEGAFFASGDYGHDDVESLLQFWGEDGTPLKSMRGSKAEYRNVRWSPKGEFLASASDALRVWTKDGELAHVGDSPDLLWGLDWDARSRSIVTASRKGAIRVWTEDAKQVRELF
jgi:WD40 repeat protein